MDGSDISSKIRALPNIGLQTDRLFMRHLFHCPKCGKMCNSNYVPLPKKSLYASDIVIHCDECGDTILSSRKIKGKDCLVIKGTDETYDPLEEREKAYRDMMSADRSDLKAYVDICNRYADELRAETRTDELYVPYVNSMSAILDDLKRNGTKNLEYACIQTLNCNSISKLELFDVLIEIYRIARDNEDVLPRPLYIKIMTEYYILDYAYDNIFYDDDHLTDMMGFCAYDFEKMTEDERSVYPFTAFEAYKTILSDRRRYGKAKGVKDAAKKMIESMDNALSHGAPVERDNVISYIGVHSEIGTKRTNPYKSALKKTDMWSNDRLYVGCVSAAYADFEFRTKLCDSDSKYAVGDSAAVSDVLKNIDTAIECLESEIDMEHIGYWLANSYSIRGAILGRKDDLENAVNYSDFFADIGCMSDDDVRDVCGNVVQNTELGCPLQLKAFRIMGFPQLW